jgi:hypothetical protein
MKSDTDGRHVCYLKKMLTEGDRPTRISRSATSVQPRRVARRNYAGKGSGARPCENAERWHGQFQCA